MKKPKKKSDKPKKDWHKFFDLLVTDFFEGTEVKVDAEVRLGTKTQRLDLALIQNQGFTGELPDGLEGMVTYNLITYKSHWEPLDDWALKELTSHYVTYRKEVNPASEEMPDEDKFRLYGISTRFPEKLSSQLVLTPVCAGVYDTKRGTDAFRIIVLSEIEHHERNAIWMLLSGVDEMVRKAADLYKFRILDLNVTLRDLLLKALPEDHPMKIDLHAYNCEAMKRVYTVDERLEGISVDDIVKRLSPDDIVKRLSPDDRLKGLSAQEIEAYLDSIKKKAPKKKKSK